MILEFQKGKNSFFLNIYHPKFLTAEDDGKASIGSVEGVVEGKYVNQEEVSVSEKKLVGEKKQIQLKLQNTHRQMDWQIGYGRRITLVENKSEKVVMVPHIAVGISTGKTQSSYTDSQGNRQDYESGGEVQGVNVTVGNRLQYERKRLSFFMDESLTASKLRHPFLDGSAVYDMRYLTNTIGISFQLNRAK